MCLVMKFKNEKKEINNVQTRENANVYYMWSAEIM